MRWMYAVISFIMSLILFAFPAAAFSLSGLGDSIKGASIGALALVVTGILALFGLVTKAKLFSGILLAVAALLHSLAALPEYLGHVLQDGKIETDELKGVPKVWNAFIQQWKTTWGMITGKPNG